jgi:hypothetical protein
MRGPYLQEVVWRLAGHPRPRCRGAKLGLELAESTGAADLAPHRDVGVEQQLGTVAEAVSAQRVPSFDQELVTVVLEQFLGTTTQAGL